MGNTRMVINNVEILPGEEKQINLSIAKLPTRTSIDVPVIVNRAKEAGPTLLLMAGMHGDEINGVEIVRRIISRKFHIPTKGTIICIPILNIYGFLHFSRQVPDGKDVNRSFPGSKTGSLASQIAYYLRTQILPIIDYGLDFHTGGARINNYPQIRAMLSNPQNRELADAFASPYIINSTFRDKSFRKEASKLNKSILVYEGGESLRLRKNAVDEGVDGALRVMKYLGMRLEAPDLNHQPRIITESSWIRSKSSGLYHSFLRPGDKVTKGQTIGLVTAPFGELERPVKSTLSGHIIAINNNPVINRGDALVHIGFSK